MARAAENPFYSAFFNIILPVVILNKGGAFFAPSVSLSIALFFPLAYGLADYIRGRGVNFISLFSVFGVILTGGLALFQMRGVFFAVKEAAIPLLIALFILGSLWMKKPALQALLEKTPLFRSRLLKRKISEKGMEADYEALLRKGSLYLAASFVLSSALNFFVAIFVFKDIDSSLPSEEQREALNQQIADMTWMGYVFIALPLTLIMGLLTIYILKRLKKMTGLKTKEILKLPP